jgi:hypothetical protein
MRLFGSLKGSRFCWQMSLLGVMREGVGEVKRSGNKNMKPRDRIAHHEAAHVVMSVLQGLSVPERGIDIDAPTSVPGATGNVMVNLFNVDANADELVRRALIVSNLEIVCAGAVSDAKIRGRPLRDALRRQPSDERLALELLRNSSLLEEPGEAEALINRALKRVEARFKNKRVWDAIHELAKACIKTGGRLSKLQIEQVLGPFHVSDLETTK